MSDKKARLNPAVITGMVLVGMAVIYALITNSPISEPLSGATATTEIVMTQEGNGIKAENGMLVSVHYQGRLEDGTVFDDSHKRGEPISFTLGSGMVIKGWEQGIEGMTVGEKRTLTIPPELGYGAAGAGDVIPPNATLIFDVELMDATIPPTLANIGVRDVEAALADNVVVIDIREPHEWEQTGIIDGAFTITAFTPQGQVHPEFLTKFNEAVPSKDTPFVLYCHSSGRSHGIGQALVEQLGFSEASHLTGGIEAWLDDGKTTVPHSE